MFEKSQQQLNSWKADMRAYEKDKRTKKPFGPSIPRISHVTYEDVKQKQVRFNPILQNYRKYEDQLQRANKQQMNRAKSLINHVKQHQKYQRPYDIVNLHGNQQNSIEQNNLPKKLGPIRNAYNVINNQKLPDFHFKDRQMRLPIERQKTLLAVNQKQFNIVSNIYNDEHELRSRIEEQDEKNHVSDKYWKTHDYDPVFGKFYDAERQKKFQQQRKIKQQQHGRDCDKNLPPSYVYRQAFIHDPSKPLPQSLQTLDQRRQNAKKRYRLKYIVEDEYGRRNVEDEHKKQKTITNKVHVGRVQQQKSKDFNIVTMKDYPKTRAEQLYRKPIVKSTWEQLSHNKSSNNASNSSKFVPSIKTAGFN